MMYLLSGKPGSGKTLWAVTQGMAWVGEGRPVYALDINGLNFEATGIKPWPHNGIAEWEKAEPNAVLIVDEVQRFLKPRPQGAVVPDWIEAFTRNRHGGIDLLFLTQDPLLIDAYPRRLVNYHKHLIAMDGNFEAANLFEANEVMDVKRVHKQALSRTLWRYPKQNYALYKSAELHTKKKHIPKSIVWAAILSLLVAVCGGVAWSLMSSLEGTSADEPAAKPATAVDPQREQPARPPGAFAQVARIGADPKAVTRYETASEYFDLMKPVVPGMLWTAPMYQGREAEAPEVACVSSADSCTCVTVPQGVVYKLDDGLCRAVARHGILNPYKRPQASPGSSDQARPVEAVTVVQTGTPPRGTSGAARVGTAYVPPEKVKGYGLE